jgi:hypothetical protein
VVDPRPDGSVSDVGVGVRDHLTAAEVTRLARMLSLAEFDRLPQRIGDPRGTEYWIEYQGHRVTCWGWGSDDQEFEPPTMRSVRVAMFPRFFVK